MTPWNGSHASSGDATAIVAINTAVAATPVSAKRRRTRNGSKRQISHNSGTATTPAAINCICKCGNTESMNEKVSRSMIRKSRNVSVSCRIPNLKCDSAIRITMRASAIAAQTPGRCSTTSRKQFRKTHASTESVIANGPYSVVSSTASPARWTATIRPAGAKNLIPRDSARMLSFIPGSVTADIRPQSPLMKPASINNRLNLRASAPSLQA